MSMTQYPDFHTALEKLTVLFRGMSKPVHTEKWQGFDIKDRPEAEMRECLNVSFQVPLGHENIDRYRAHILPNLPWADEHFEERVCGAPLNPGTTWKTWPWANKADESRKFGPENDQFSHTYMERYWPIHAGETNTETFGHVTNFGTRFKYGDLDSLIKLLHREPGTRQAYLPIFFPEDTGAEHGNRVPCTLGYHFIQRDGFLHIFYPIRSCDMYRHLRDDLYLTTRLLLWVLGELRKLPQDGENSIDWMKVQPGIFSMWIGSLHMFINDYRLTYGGA